MKKVVMVVDDSSTMRKFISFSLKMHDFDVIAATDGMDALEKLSTTPADLAIVDLNMPVMDGYELIETLRASKRYQELPIIILSSEQSDSAKQRGKEAGADSYLVKPFDAKMVSDHVARILGKDNQE